MQETDAWLLNRKVPLAHKLSTKQLESLKEVFSSLNGVKSISKNIDGNQLYITYDARFISYKQIIDTFQKEHLKIKQSFAQKLKTNWYIFIDDNVKTNAKTPPSACCNKVPRIK